MPAIYINIYIKVVRYRKIQQVKGLDWYLKNIVAILIVSIAFF